MDERARKLQEELEAMEQWLEVAKEMRADPEGLGVSRSFGWLPDVQTMRACPPMDLAKYLEDPVYLGFPLLPVGTKRSHEEAPQPVPKGKRP